MLRNKFTVFGAHILQTTALLKDFQYVVLYGLSILFIVGLRGPTYTAGFLFLFIIGLYLLYKDLSLSLFFAYLLTLFIGKPALNIPVIQLQDFVYFEPAQLVSSPVNIQIRTIVFVFFLLSLLNFKSINKRLPVGGIALLAPVLIVLIMLLWIIVGQFMGNYPVVFSWTFFHLFQILLVFPSVTIFLLRRMKDANKISLIRQAIIQFVLFALIMEGVLAGAQFVKKSSIGINLETPFKIENIVAPENNGFRSPGSFEHPNYLGSNVAILLPTAIYFFIFYALQKIKKKYILAAVASGLGTIALATSMSRWAWISFMVGIIGMLVFSKILLISGRNKQKQKNRPFLLWILIILLSIFLLLIYRFKTVNTFEGRVSILQSYVQMIQKSPLWGMGPGNSNVSLFPYRFSLEAYLSSIKAAHNTFILFAADLGLPAALLFISIVICWISQTIRRRKTIQQDPFLVSLGAGILTFMLCSLAYPLYTFDPSLELFLLFLSTYNVYLFLPPANKASKNY